MLSNDTRQQLIEAFEKNQNAKEVAEYYGVHISTVYRLRQRKEETGDVKVLTERCGRKRTLSEEDILKIDHAIEERPDITIRELQEKLDLPCSHETLRKAALELGWRYKKKSVYASERRRLRCGGKAGGMGGEYRYTERLTNWSFWMKAALM